MKKLIGVIALCILIAGTGCTGNQMARSYGGIETVELPVGQRLVNLTWKETNLWILTENKPGKTPTTYSFKEKSPLGIVEGEVVIVEK